MTIIENILEKAKKSKAQLILPELNDDRVKEASRIIEEHGIAKVVNKTQFITFMQVITNVFYERSF